MHIGGVYIDPQQALEVLGQLAPSASPPFSASSSSAEPGQHACGRLRASRATAFRVRPHAVVSAPKISRKKRKKKAPRPVSKPSPALATSETAAAAGRRTTPEGEPAEELSREIAAPARPGAPDIAARRASDVVPARPEPRLPAESAGRVLDFPVPKGPEALKRDSRIVDRRTEPPARPPPRMSSNRSSSRRRPHHGA